MDERLATARLYLLATTSVARGPLPAAVEAAIDGGVDVVQLREKTMADEELYDVAVRLRALCRARGVLFVVDDRADIAAVVGADGVHLGISDLPIASARAVLAPGRIVGFSVHDEGELAVASGDGADYVGVGSVFPTKTKGRDVPVAGPLALAAIAARAEAAGMPAFAIGGITRDNVADVVAAGFRRVAVCAGSLATPSPRDAAAALRAVLTTSRA